MRGDTPEQSMDADPHVVVFQQRGGQVLGSVAIGPSGGDAVYIHGLQVLPRYRGAGLGARLMASALRIGAGWGRTTAILEADDNGSGRLVRWYERLGFEQIGMGKHGRPLMKARLRR